VQTSGLEWPNKTTNLNVLVTVSTKVDTLKCHDELALGFQQKRRIWQKRQIWRNFGEGQLELMQMSWHQGANQNEGFHDNGELAI